MVCISRSSKVILGVQKGHFGVENRKYGQMHMICIPFDWKFFSESNGMHLKVIRGHLRGQLRSSEVKNRSISHYAPSKQLFGQNNCLNPKLYYFVLARVEFTCQMRRQLVFKRHERIETELKFFKNCEKETKIQKKLKNI